MQIYIKQEKDVVGYTHKTRRSESAVFISRMTLQNKINVFLPKARQIPNWTAQKTDLSSAVPKPVR